MNQRFLVYRRFNLLFYCTVYTRDFSIGFAAFSIVLATTYFEVLNPTIFTNKIRKCCCFAICILCCANKNLKLLLFFFR